MNLLQRINKLSKTDEISRRNAIQEVLNDAGLMYTLQEQAGEYNNPLGIVNYLIESDTPSLLFCAHYDAVPGSSGANDNAAAVSILIELALELKKKAIPASFAFFDCEENKCAGSKYFIKNSDLSNITAAINLDLCGYGDIIAIYAHGNKAKKTPALEPFFRKNITSQHSIREVVYLPQSDGHTISSHGIPVLSMSVLPYTDIAFLKALNSMSRGFIGKSPEYDMVLSQMDISSTMHGGAKDDPKYLQPEAMDNILSYLICAAESEPALPGKGIFSYANLFFH